MARNLAGNILASQPISLRLSIHDVTPAGTVVYSETHNVTTTSLGLFNVNIGQGTIITGTLAGVNWGTGVKYLEAELDPAYPSSYISMGTTLLISVPYALFAKTTSNPCGYVMGQNVPALGGFIFYLDASGCHGLVCAPTDQSAGVQWYNGTFTNTTAFGSAVGAGYGNTCQIKFNQGAGTYAASVSNSYAGGGFNDWYLPSRYELNLMYLNIGQGNALGLGNVGGFANVNYWSSTESDNFGNAWSQTFSGGNQLNDFKFLPFHVRAVRAF